MADWAVCVLCMLHGTDSVNESSVCGKPAGYRQSCVFVVVYEMSEGCGVVCAGCMTRVGCAG
jgi:hypothetical protein